MGLMEAAAGHILVIGGGLIGTEVALDLSQRGARVVVVSRSISPRLGALGPEAGIELVTSEAGQGAALTRAAEGCSAVVCLAGSSTPAGAAADPERALQGSLGPVLATLESAAEAGVPRAVIASSGGTVYGAGAPIPTSENAPLEPSSLHGVNSLAAEDFASYYGRERGMAVSVLRFSNVYGPGAQARRGQGVITAWTRALARGRPVTLIGPETARRDFVFSTDAAAAVRLAVTAPAGIYNVGGGETVALADLLDCLREVSGSEPEVERLPDRGVDVPVTHLDISKLRDAAGWEPRVGLREGVAAVWSWETSGS